MMKYITKEHSISILGISNRSYDALRAQNLNTIEDLLSFDLDTLHELPNLGGESVREILTALDNISTGSEGVICLLPNASTPKKLEKCQGRGKNSSAPDPLIAKIATPFISEICSFSKIYETRLTHHLHKRLKKVLIRESFIYEEFKDLENPDLINFIYSDRLVLEILERHLFTLIQAHPSGLPLSKVKSSFPSHLDQAALDKTLATIQRKNKNVKLSGDVIFAKIPTILEYADSLRYKRDGLLLRGRLNGLTLMELGETSDITRERVRQVVKAALIMRPIVKEDIYKDAFEKYEFSQSIFMKIFKEPEITYNYLKLTYIKGNLPAKQLVDDATFSDKFREATGKVLSNYSINVDGEEIKCNVKDISIYLIKNHFTEDTPFRTFLTTYRKFLKEHGLDSDQDLILRDSHYINSLGINDYILWKPTKTLRYYPMAYYDYSNLIHELHLNKYKDLEYSALKFFREYPDVMKKYDLHDGYELHNLLRKILKQTPSSGILVGSSPNIEFGEINRKTQVFNLLLDSAPISSEDFLNLYEQKYGVLVSIVKSFYVKYIMEYLDDGFYRMDMQTLSDEQLSILKKNLTEEFYSYPQIEEIFASQIPGGNPDNLNGMNMVKLGFRPYDTFILKNTYKHSSDYFKKVLTESETFGLKGLPIEMRNQPNFTITLAKTKASYDILEISPLIYINIKKLRSYGFTKKNMADYCEKVRDFAIDDSFFSILSLRQSGFSHPLDELGFDPWFYSSALCQGNKDLTFIRTENTHVFRKNHTPFTLHDFIVSILEDMRMINIYDLLALLKAEHGIAMRKHKLVDILKKGSMPYSRVTRKVYADLATYLENS